MPSCNPDPGGVKASASAMMFKVRRVSRSNLEDVVEGSKEVKSAGIIDTLRSGATKVGPPAD